MCSDTGVTCAGHWAVLLVRLKTKFFLQTSKLSMIPVVCLMEWVLNSKHYTTKVISAVVVVAAGVGICTVTDVEVNAKGFLCACVAVFCTSLQQIVSSFPCLLPSFMINFCIVFSLFMMLRILVSGALIIFCNVQ